MTDNMMTGPKPSGKRPTRAATELRVQLDTATVMPAWASCWAEPIRNEKPRATLAGAA